MYNDESNRSSQGQSQGQSSFVPRRPIPKYNGDKSGSYQGQSQQGGYSSGYSNSSYNNGEGRQHSGGRSYDSSRPRREGGGYDRGDRSGSGGYQQRGYGYNRNNNYGGGPNDRLIRQNDIIIKLLKDIRDRLPAPPGMSSDSDNYGDSSYSRQSYQSNSSYGQSDDEADFEVAEGQQDGDQAVDRDDTADQEEDEYNS